MLASEAGNTESDTTTFSGEHDDDEEDDDEVDMMNEEDASFENETSTNFTTRTIPGARSNDARFRGNWTEEQDEALRLAVETYGAKNWRAISEMVPGNRTHIQCLQRWSKVS